MLCSCRWGVCVNRLVWKIKNCGWRRPWTATADRRGLQRTRRIVDRQHEGDGHRSGISCSNGSERVFFPEVISKKSSFSSGVERGRLGLPGPGSQEVWRRSDRHRTRLPLPFRAKNAENFLKGAMVTRDIVKKGCIGSIRGEFSENKHSGGKEYRQQMVSVLMNVRWAGVEPNWSNVLEFHDIGRRVFTSQGYRRGA